MAATSKEPRRRAELVSERAVQPEEEQTHLQRRRGARAMCTHAEGTGERVCHTVWGEGRSWTKSRDSVMRWTWNV